MSFYTVIKTQVSNRKYVLAALAEMQKKGEIIKFAEDEKTEKIEVDRDGDKLTLSVGKDKNYQVGGDNRIARAFSDRLAQVYALESIKDNIPLDFELAEEQETAAGEVMLLLKD